MKKILIASTALMAAGLMTTGTAAASDKIKLELGGFSKWWVVGAWQDDSFEAAINNGTAGQGSPANVDVKGDNEIFVGGETTLDNGLTVGVTVELEAGGNTETTGGDAVDKSFAFVEGGFGKVILGSESGSAVLLHVMAPDAAGNVGGDGLLTGGWAIARPANFTGQVSTEVDTDAEAEKIIYVSPTFHGLTVGASYVPSATEDNRQSFGTAGATTNDAAGFVGVSALYANTFGEVDVKVSGAWMTYDTAATNSRSQEWSAGTQLSYGDFTVGGAYRNIRQNLKGNVGNSAIADATADNTGYVWDAGIQYASGPYAVSFVYFKSVAEGTIAAAAGEGQDQLEIYQVSGTYSLGAGVDLLATVGHVEYDDETAKTANADANHNEGWAVMTGLSLAF